MGAFFNWLRPELGGMAIIALGVLALFGVAEFLSLKLKWATERTRKLVHIGCGGLIALTPQLFKSVHVIGILSAAFLILLVGARGLGQLKSVHGVRRSSFGAYAYPVAAYVTALLTWRKSGLFESSILLLALGDGLAALVGKTMGRRKYRLGDHVRSIEGSATVLLVGGFVTAMVLGATGAVRWPEAWIIGMLAGGIVTAVEALSLWGIDNALIPVLSALYLRAAVQWSGAQLWWHLIAAASCLAIAVMVQLRGYVRVSGAVAAWLVGYLVLGFGGFDWFAPLLAFFLAINWMGKLIERIFPGRLPQDFERIEEKGSKRDFVQVFANAGVAMALVVGHATFGAKGGGAIWYWAFIGSLCAACADTFASEIGILSGKRPISILTFKPLATGLSGGVTLHGYLGACLGALLPIGVIALGGSPYPLDGSTVLAALACGLLGSTADSLAGALLQSRSRCQVCHKLLEKREHCGRATEHERGFKWITNDVVNALGALVGAAAGALLL